MPRGRPPRRSTKIPDASSVPQVAVPRAAGLRARREDRRSGWRARRRTVVRRSGACRDGTRRRRTTRLRRAFRSVASTAIGRCRRRSTFDAHNRRAAMARIPEPQTDVEHASFRDRSSIGERFRSRQDTGGSWDADRSRTPMPGSSARTTSSGCGGAVARSAETTSRRPTRSTGNAPSMPRPSPPRRPAGFGAPDRAEPERPEMAEASPTMAIERSSAAGSRRGR